METPLKPNNELSELEKARIARENIEDAFLREQALERGMPYVPTMKNKNQKVPKD
jgi:hypothetical protein